MPVYLTYLICAIGSGACHNTAVLAQPLMGLAACQIQGMQMAPSWQDAHPGWRVAKIRCTLGNPPKDDDGV